MNFKKLSAVAAATLFSTSLVCAHEAHQARADSHAPIGVMGDHLHKEGEWMFSYRYMNMAMEGLRDGNERVSTADAHDSYHYMNAPLKMDMQMHMLGAMYAPSDKVTFMVMLPYVEKSMDLLMKMPMGPTYTPFTTETKGVGDIKLAAMLPLYNYQGGKMHSTLSVSLPTGSIDEKDQTAMSMGNEVQLPYGMQLGSGTYDLRPAITWTKLNAGWSWGAQTTATIRTGGKNDNGYRLGNALEAQTWVAWSPSQSVSVSSCLKWQAWGDIEGADSTLNPAMVGPGTAMMGRGVPTADPDLQAGRRTDLHVGVNWLSDAGHRLAVEYGMPIQQHLDGPQMELDSVATVGYQYAF